MMHMKHRALFGAGMANTSSIDNNAPLSAELLHFADFLKPHMSSTAALEAAKRMAGRRARSSYMAAGKRVLVFDPHLELSAQPWWAIKDGRKVPGTIVAGVGKELPHAARKLGIVLDAVIVNASISSCGKGDQW